MPTQYAYYDYNYLLFTNSRCSDGSLIGLNMIASVSPYIKFWQALPAMMTYFSAPPNGGRAFTQCAMMINVYYNPNLPEGVDTAYFAGTDILTTHQQTFINWDIGAIGLPLYASPPPNTSPLYPVPVDPASPPLPPPPPTPTPPTPTPTPPTPTPPTPAPSPPTPTPPPKPTPPGPTPAPPVPPVTPPEPAPPTPGPAPPTPGPAPPTPSPEKQDTAAPKDNTLIYIIAGSSVGALAIIALAVCYICKMKHQRLARQLNNYETLGGMGQE